MITANQDIRPKTRKQKSWVWRYSFIDSQSQSNISLSGL